MWFSLVFVMKVLIWVMFFLWLIMLIWLNFDLFLLIGNFFFFNCVRELMVKFFVVILFIGDNCRIIFLILFLIFRLDNELLLLLKVNWFLLKENFLYFVGVIFNVVENELLNVNCNVVFMGDLFFVVINSGCVSLLFIKFIFVVVSVGMILLCINIVMGNGLCLIFILNIIFWFGLILRLGVLLLNVICIWKWELKKFLLKFW